MVMRSDAANVKLVFWLIVFVTLVCNYIAWSAWDVTFMMNDAIQYLSTAKNWLLGEGLSTNALIYNPHFQGELPAPQTVWPPGLPALLIVASYAGFSLKTTALFINLLTMAIAAVLVYAILRRCRVGQLFALCSAALFYLTCTSWHQAMSLLSEPLFTCLVLAAIYFVPLNLLRHPWSWLLSGLFIAVCITVRHTGVFTAAAFGFGVFLVLLLNRSARSTSIGFSFMPLGMLLLLPISTFILLMVRTQHHVGSIERNTGVGSSKPFIETARKFAEESSIVMGFMDGWLFSGDIDTWLFILFALIVTGMSVVAIILSCGFWFRRVKSQTILLTENDSEDHYPATIVSIIVVHTLIFSGFLMYCSMGSSPLNVTSRYLYQLYPGLFIVFCLLVWFLVDQSRFSKKNHFKLLVKVSVSCLVFLYLTAQLNMVPIINEYASRSAEVKAVIQLPVTDEIKLADIVRSCVGTEESAIEFPASSLWSNEGAYVHLYTGVNTITLTEIYTTPTFDFERLKTDINDYGIRLFIFVNNDKALQGEYGIMLNSIKNWLSAKQYPKLQLQQSDLVAGITVDVFAIDGNCFQMVLK